MNKHELKKRIVEESSLLFFYTLFIFAVLSTFTLYRRLILSEFSISYIHYSYNFVEALVLAKVIWLGQVLRLGERFKNRSLIIPTVYKTLVFGLFVFAFSIAEHFFVNFVKGAPISVAYNEITALGLDEILARTIIMLFVFVFFFAFLEIGRILGGSTLFDLFLRRKRTKSDEIKQKHNNQ